MGDGRRRRWLLVLVPLGLCLIPAVATVAGVGILFFSFGNLDLEQTSPDCVHDEDALRSAAREGDVAEVRAQVAAGADLEGADSNGNTALYCAAFRGHADALTALAEAGAEVDHGNLSGETGLHWASRHGDATAVAALLSAGAEPDVRTERGQTPLLWASLEGRVEAVSLLLDAGADPTATSPSSTLEAAAALVPAVSTSGTAPASPLPRCTSFDDPAFEVTALHAAVAAGRHGVVPLLLEAGADPDAVGGGCTPLHVAAWRCDVEVAMALHDAGATGVLPTPGSTTAAEDAEARGCTAVAALLGAS